MGGACTADRAWERVGDYAGCLCRFSPSRGLEQSRKHPQGERVGKRIREGFYHFCQVPATSRSHTKCLNFLSRSFSISLYLCLSLALSLSPGARYKRIPHQQLAAAGFFRHLYYTTAETLPHTAEVWEDLHQTDTADARANDPEKRRKLLEDILDAVTTSPLDQESRQGPEGLSRRWLPPGRLSPHY